MWESIRLEIDPQSLHNNEDCDWCDEVSTVYLYVAERLIETEDENDYVIERAFCSDCFKKMITNHARHPDELLARAVAARMGIYDPLNHRWTCFEMKKGFFRYLVNYALNNKHSNWFRRVGAEDTGDP